MARKWHRVPGSFEQEFSYYEGDFRLPCNTSITSLLGPLALELRKDSEDEHTFDLVISFVSSGYYDPGRTYGPPENCYPPEYEDERELESIAVIWEGITGESRELALPEKQAQEVFDYFSTQIDEVEIDEDYDVGEY